MHSNLIAIDSNSIRCRPLCCVFGLACGGFGLDGSIAPSIDQSGSRRAVFTWTGERKREEHISCVGDTWARFRCAMMIDQSISTVGRRRLGSSVTRPNRRPTAHSRDLCSFFPFDAGRPGVDHRNQTQNSQPSRSTFSLLAFLQNLYILIHASPANQFNRPIVYTYTLARSLAPRLLLRRLHVEGDADDSLEPRRHLVPRLDGAHALGRPCSVFYFI